MDGASTIIVAVSIALVLVGAGIVASYGVQETAQEYDATDSVTLADVGNITELNNSSSAYYWGDSVEVETSNNKLLVPDEDYTWNKNNGTLTTLSTDAAGTTVDVTYSYGAQSDSQQATTTLISDVIEVGAYIPFLLILALLFFALSVFGGLS